MIVLTEAQLTEVERIIEETVVITDWMYDHDLGESVEVDDTKGTLREAAKRVRAYIDSL